MPAQLVKRIISFTTTDAFKAAQVSFIRTTASAKCATQDVSSALAHPLVLSVQPQAQY